MSKYNLYSPVCCKKIMDLCGTNISEKIINSRGYHYNVEVIKIVFQCKNCGKIEIKELEKEQ